MCNNAGCIPVFQGFTIVYLVINFKLYANLACENYLNNGFA
jgi:hypothetical protein